jgi:hypothetical protein
MVNESLLFDFFEAHSEKRTRFTRLPTSHLVYRRHEAANPLEEAGAVIGD